MLTFFNDEKKNKKQTKRQRMMSIYQKLIIGKNTFLTHEVLVPF